MAAARSRAGAEGRPGLPPSAGPLSRGTPLPASPAGYIVPAAVSFPAFPRGGAPAPALFVPHNNGQRAWSPQRATCPSSRSFQSPCGPPGRALPGFAANRSWEGRGDAREATARPTCGVVCRRAQRRAPRGPEGEAAPALLQPGPAEAAAARSSGLRAAAPRPREPRGRPSAARTLARALRLCLCRNAAGPALGCAVGERKRNILKRGNMSSLMLFLIQNQFLCETQTELLIILHLFIFH